LYLNFGFNQQFILEFAGIRGDHRTQIRSTKKKSRAGSRRSADEPGHDSQGVGDDGVAIASALMMRESVTVLREALASFMPYS
jgi:hypothetical protein